MGNSETSSEWRAKMQAVVYGGSTSDALDALLSLTYYEGDRSYIESILLKVLDSDLDIQIRALAVVCLGHVARIHRSITKEIVIPRLREIQADSVFSARAENALEDIEIFAKGD